MGEEGEKGGENCNKKEDEVSSQRSQLQRRQVHVRLSILYRYCGIAHSLHKILESPQPLQSNMAAAALFGDALKNKAGDDVPPSSALDGAEFVGIYFSAHWCGPCRRCVARAAMSAGVSDPPP
jgi:hypothetical protein